MLKLRKTKLFILFLFFSSKNSYRSGPVKYRYSIYTSGSSNQRSLPEVVIRETVLVRSDYFNLLNSRIELKSTGNGLCVCGGLSGLTHRLLDEAHIVMARTQGYFRSIELLDSSLTSIEDVDDFAKQFPFRIDLCR